MMPFIQAVFFDLGDTLVCISPDTLEKICKYIGEIRENPLIIEDYRNSFLNEWNKPSRLSDTESVKGINANSDNSERQYWKNFFESLLPSLGISSCQPELVKWLISVYTDPQYFVCFDDVHNVLSELKNKGLTLGIISNAFPSAEKIIDHLNLRQYFKYIFLSFELPYAKPETRIYQFAAEKTGTQIKDILFVDDRLNFVKGAQKASMNALLIERNIDKLCKFPTKSLVHRIKSLTELLSIVEPQLDKALPTDTQKASTTVPTEYDQNLCVLPTKQFAT